MCSKVDVNDMNVIAEDCDCDVSVLVNGDFIAVVNGKNVSFLKKNEFLKMVRVMNLAVEKL